MPFGNLHNSDWLDKHIRVKLIRNYASETLIRAVVAVYDKLSDAVGEPPPVYAVGEPSQVYTSQPPLGLPVGNGGNIVVSWPSNSNKIFTL